MIRDSGQIGSLGAMAVFIDGKQAAKLEPGQKASFYLPPDSVSVGAAYTGSGICSMGVARVEREAMVKDGTVKKYQQSASPENAPSYAFGSAKNTKASGNPVPICIGERRWSGMIISASILAEDKV